MPAVGRLGTNRFRRDRMVPVQPRRRPHVEDELVNASDQQPDQPGPVNTLRVLETHPDAPRCQQGHGTLTAGTDNASPLGVSLVCPTCGERQNLEMATLETLLRNPADPSGLASSALRIGGSLADTTQIPRIAAQADGQTCPIPVVATPKRQDVPASRGSRPDGTIRTTGWLQVGRYPVSSGIWAALAGAAAGLMLDGFSLLPALFGAIAWTVWKIATRWVWPSSVVINRENLEVTKLRPGMYTRIYGAIGPVGVIDHIAIPHHDRAIVYFTGGTVHQVSAQSRCCVVEVRN